MSFLSQTFDKTEQESSVNDILRTERVRNKQQPWARLNKTDKISKLNLYVIMMSDKYELEPDEIVALKHYLVMCIERKRLVTVKDVVYDSETGEINDIPLLSFEEATRTFSLQRSVSRNSTLASLSKPKN